MNKKLFHLANEVVRMRQKIDEVFPNDSTGNKTDLNIFFSEILGLINHIRMAVAYPEKEEKIESYSFYIEGNHDSISDVLDFLEDKKLKYFYELKSTSK